MKSQVKLNRPIQMLQLLNKLAKFVRKLLYFDASYISANATEHCTLG